ncbi:hypothetical protein Tco_0355179 [Tanacetum coccineum]
MAAGKNQIEDPPILELNIVLDVLKGVKLRSGDVESSQSGNLKQYNTNHTNTDKHGWGTPSEALCFKVALLDPSPIYWSMRGRLEIRTTGCGIWKNLGHSEWSTLAGLKLARENLQSRVKEEDSITDVENAVFDLGVMDSLCFLLMTCLSIYKLVRSAPDGCFVSRMEGLKSVIQFVRPRGMIFAHGPFKNSFQTTIGYLNLPTCLWVVCGGETMSDSVFKHDLCKLVIAKMGSAITYDCTRGTKSGEESFKKFATIGHQLVEERFLLQTHFDR